MAKLIFNHQQLLPLILMTEKAKVFRIPYENKTQSKPTLWIVKDDGIYLMVSAHMDKIPKDMSHVCYAKGYNPKTDGDVYDKCRNAVGGDDFVEEIEFPEQWQNAIKKGCGLSITMNKNSFKIEVIKP